MMTAPETRRTLDFFADALLDRMDLEAALDGDSRATCGWVGRFNTLGLFEHALPKVWREWWRADRPATAICVVQYASALVYFAGENPVYAPWTCDNGGGGPYLTEWDCSVFDHAWLPSNIAFLREILTVNNVIDRLDAATATLGDAPPAEMARTIACAARGRRDVIELRIADMIDQFGRLQLERDLWDRG